MTDLKKKVKQTLKQFLLKMSIHNVECKYKSDGLDLFYNKAEIGRLGLASASKKFADPGGEFAMYVVCSVKGGKAISTVQEMNLSYPNFFHKNHYFGFSSLYFRSDKFFNEGSVSFSGRDNIEETCAEIVNRINTLYTSEIENIIDGNMAAVENIFKCPKNYGFPMAFILAICKITHREDLYDEMIKKGISKKLYDATETRIAEILSKLKAS